VDHMRYTQSSPAGDRQLVIGWIGSPSTQRYVVDIKDAIQSVCYETGARLMLVGATKDIEGQLLGIPVDVVPWGEETEAGNIGQMDVGIMPLIDGPWERGKCGYKIIQYMASGVPVVASPVGVNIEIVNGSLCGSLASSLEEWQGALQKILSSGALRHELGAAGRAAVEQRYSLQVQASVWANILKQV